MREREIEPSPFPRSHEGGGLSDGVEQGEREVHSLQLLLLLAGRHRGGVAKPLGNDPRYVGLSIA